LLTARWTVSGTGCIYRCEVITEECPAIACIVNGGSALPGGFLRPSAPSVPTYESCPKVNLCQRRFFGSDICATAVPLCATGLLSTRTDVSAVTPVRWRARRNTRSPSEFFERG